MKITQIPDLAVHNARVPLELINVVPDYVSDLVEASQQTRYAQMRFDGENRPDIDTALLTSCYPVVVISIKDRYACVANRRALSVLKRICHPRKRIPVAIVDAKVVGVDVLRAMTAVDILIQPMVGAVLPGKIESYAHTEGIRQCKKRSNESGASYRTVMRKIDPSRIQINNQTNGRYRFHSWDTLSEMSRSFLFFIMRPVVRKVGDSYVAIANSRHLEGLQYDTQHRSIWCQVASADSSEFDGGMATDGLSAINSINIGAAGSLSRLYRSLSRTDKEILFRGRMTQEIFAGILQYRREHMFSIHRQCRAGRVDGGGEKLDKYGIGERNG